MKGSEEDHAGKEKKIAGTSLEEKLRIRELDEYIPIGNDGLVNESNIFHWYRIQNKREYHALNKACGNTVREPSVYPELICVETVEGDACKGEAYAYHLADRRKVTEAFWKQMGYKCTIEKEQRNRIGKKKGD